MAVCARKEGGRERMILKSMDAEKLLRDFARWSALKVLHLWPNPPDVVVKFLKTGDESLRDAARAAANDDFIRKSRAQFKRMVNQTFKAIP